MDHTDNQKFTVAVLDSILQSPHFDLEKFKAFVSSKAQSLHLSSGENNGNNLEVTNFTKDYEHFAQHGNLDRPKVRGLVEGVFDMTHFGHFNAMRQAKKLCDELVVAVNGDEQVILHKGFFY